MDGGSLQLARKFLHHAAMVADYPTRGRERSQRKMNPVQNAKSR
jgi:hypothetical protein